MLRPTTWALGLISALCAACAADGEIASNEPGGGGPGTGGVPDDSGSDVWPLSGTGGNAGAAGAASGGAAGAAAGDAAGASTGGAAGVGSGGSGTGGTGAWPPPLDLASVVWLHKNVSSWPVTLSLSKVTVSGSSICLDHDIPTSWPTVNVNVDVNANPWVFIFHDGKWYGATWEWLKPGQECKSASSVAGDHIKDEPFQSMGWKPSSGETLYFMVSGVARLGLSNVQERSEPLKIVWP